MSTRRNFAQPLDLTSLDQRTRDRFWSKVDRREAHECWPWISYRKASGYGQFVLRKGVPIIASRASLAMTMPLAAGVLVCHSCDNPPCVNPAHLFPGSASDNTLDSVVKGRANRSHGEAHRDARLSPAAVAYIRAQDVSQYGRKTQLAREFGVSLTAIRRVIAGATWRNVA